jgi:hypothetical protein
MCLSRVHPAPRSDARHTRGPIRVQIRVQPGPAHPVREGSTSRSPAPTSSPTSSVGLTDLGSEGPNLLRRRIDGHPQPKSDHTTVSPHSAQVPASNTRRKDRRSLSPVAASAVVMAMVECNHCHQVIERRSPMQRHCDECRQRLKGSRSREAMRRRRARCGLARRIVAGAVAVGRTRHRRRHGCQAWGRIFEVWRKRLWGS